MITRQLYKVARLSSVRASIRGIAGFPASSGFSIYSEALETDIRAKLDALPSPSKAFQNADGSTKSTEDKDLQALAILSALGKEKRASFGDIRKMNADQLRIFAENSNELAEFLDSGYKILDKIPYKDAKTGEVKWQVVREKQQEGWEKLIYFGYIPALLVGLTFALFLDGETVSDWALEELRLRAQEKYNASKEDLAKDASISPEELKQRDALIVERILSGEYDKLAGLKKAGKDLPTDLV